jgi:hypothetical protein
MSIGFLIHNLQAKNENFSLASAQSASLSALQTNTSGEVVEWLMAPVLKTGVG